MAGVIEVKIDSTTEMKMRKILMGAAIVGAILHGSAFMSLAESKPASEAKKAKPYPLKTCVVTDEKLGEMGKPFVLKHEAREVQLCCKGCVKDFKKEPAKYIKKIETAEKNRKPAVAAPKGPGR